MRPQRRPQSSIILATVRYGLKEIKLVFIRFIWEFRETRLGRSWAPLGKARARLGKMRAARKNAGNSTCRPGVWRIHNMARFDKLCHRNV